MCPIKEYTFLSFYLNVCSINSTVHYMKKAALFFLVRICQVPIFIGTFQVPIFTTLANHSDSTVFFTAQIGILFCDVILNWCFFQLLMYIYVPSPAVKMYLCSFCNKIELTIYSFLALLSYDQACRD